MNPLAFLSQFAHRISSLVSHDLDARMSRALSKWNSAGGSVRTSSSPGGRSSLGGSLFGKNSFAGRAVDWLSGGSQKGSTESRSGSLFESFLKKLMTLVNGKPGDKGSNGKLNSNISNGKSNTAFQSSGMLGGARSASRRSNSSSRGSTQGGSGSSRETSLVDLFLRRLLALTNPRQIPGQIGNTSLGGQDGILSRFISRIIQHRTDAAGHPAVNQEKISATTPEGILQQVMQQIKEGRSKSAARTRKRQKWLSARQSPLQQLSRAKGVAQRAARRYYAFAQRRDSLKQVADSARQRFLNAPGPGDPDHNPARTTSLARQSMIAWQAFEAAQSRATTAFGKVTKSANMLSQAGNIPSGIVRLIGSVGSRMFSIGSAAVAGAKVGIELPDIVRHRLESFVERDRWRGSYNMQSAGALMGFDRQTESLNARTAAATSESQRWMIDAVKAFRETSLPWSNYWANFGNYMRGGAAVAAKGGLDSVQYVADLMEALRTGNLYNKDYWSKLAETRADEARNAKNKQSTTFFDTLKAWQSVIDKDQKKALNESKPRDMLPPLR